jgi:MFS family permease
VIGYLVAVVVRPVIAVTAAAWQVIGLRVVDRLGKGLRTPPRDALIADVTPEPLRGRAFGLQRGLDHAGAVLGPLVAWAILASGTADVRTVIAASIVPGVLVVILATWAVRDQGRGEVGNRAVGAPPPLSVVPRLHPPLALFAICFFYLLRMPDTLIILHAQRLGIPVAVVPLLWAAVHVVRSSSSFLGGALSDRLGPSRTMWLGWICYALLAGGMALATGCGAAWALFLALGLVAGLTESPERALVAGYAGDRQGSGFGVFHAASGVAALAGGLLLGGAFQRAGGAFAFTASAVLGLALALLWPFVTRAHRVPAR